MPIIESRIASRRDNQRRVLAELAERRRAAPLRVIDVGGGADAWADAEVDAYADINGFSTSKEMFVGDVCQSEVWDRIAAGPRFDFSLCCHVLEDVRDPLFVARNLMRISRAGFISVPTKHSEMSNVESAFYPGYCHHRWIYTVREAPGGEAGKAAFVGLAKLPVVGYLNSSWRPLLKLLHLLGANPWLAKAERRLGVFPAGPGVGWVDRRLAGHGVELGFWWREEFPFELVNDDYAGDSCLELADLYRHALADGL